MKTISIIAEYNPFHSGHAYQIREAKKRIGTDSAVMVVMSGCFTQRGEPAILDKWTRTKAALACDVDLVLELPFAYATASAERFARGGVQLLHATGLRSHLVFGSESGSLTQLSRLAELLHEEPDAFKCQLKQFLKQGASFAAARQKAAAQVLDDPDLASQLSLSNNILAVEYLKALRKLPGDRLVPLTIKRAGQAYRDQQWSGDQVHASASAIRQLVSRHLNPAWHPEQQSLTLISLLRKLQGHMPDASLSILLEALHQGPGPLFPESFATAVIGFFRAASDQSTEQIPGMAEGLNRRLMAAAARPEPDNSVTRLASLYQQASSRRFPVSRVSRAAMAAAAGLKTADLACFDEAGGPQYIRVLGFSKKGRHLLKLMRKLADKPLILNASDFLEHGRNQALVRMSELDLIATDLWYLQAGETCGRDIKTRALQL